MEARSDGSDFEDATRRALRARRWVVTEESLRGGKRVDIIATERHLDDFVRYAVECKDYSRPLTRQQVATIIADYSALLARRSVDQVLIISKSGVSASADALIRDTLGFRHQTLRRLQDSILDFNEYTAYMQTRFRSREYEIEKFYQTPHTEDNDDLVEVLRDWASDSSNVPSRLDRDRPIAILASYGMGKSTFARFCCSAMAPDVMEGRSHRVPILIDLGGISNEQSLDGLLGKEFTSSHIIPGYDFERFLEQNADGRFVIFLDGFDEMKQRQSWSEFNYTFKQLGQLVQGESRLVVLGRPTAFAGEAHLAEVLHGSGPSPSALSTSSRSPDFQEVKIRRLNPTEVRQFLESYVSNVVDVDPPERARLMKRLKTGLEDKSFRDLAGRPVQLRMLADLLPGHPELLGGTEVHKLYDLFIDHLVDSIVARELEKEARLGISSARRRRFAQLLAYWLWVSPPESGYGMVEDVPTELVMQCSDLRDSSPAALEIERRELVIGSPVDLGRESRLTFPHRSIQEFLVSQEAWQQVVSGEIDASELDAFMTEEVASFMNSSAGTDQDRASIEVLRAAVGQMQSATYRSLAGRASVGDLLRSSLSSGGSDQLLGPWLVLAAGLDGVYGSRAMDLKRVDFEALARLNPVSTAWPLLCLLASTLGVKVANPSVISAAIVQTLSRGDQVELQPNRDRDFHYAKVSLGSRQYVGWYDKRSAGQRTHVGIRLGGAKMATTRDGRTIVSGGSAIRVRRLDPLQLGLAQMVSRSVSGGKLDLRGVRGFLAKGLVDYAFVREWTRDRKAFEQATRALNDRIELTPQLHEHAADCVALAKVFEDLAGERP